MAPGLPLSSQGASKGEKIALTGEGGGSNERGSKKLQGPLQGKEHLLPILDGRRGKNPYPLQKTYPLFPEEKMV